MSLHHYFAIFMFVIIVAAATVDSIGNQQVPTVNYLEDIKLPPTVDSIRNQQVPMVNYLEDIKLPPTVDSIRNIQQAPTVNYLEDIKLPPTVDSIRNQQAPTVNYLEDINQLPLNVNVNALTDTSYQVFITKLINAVKGNEVGGVPILPTNDNELFYVILQATDDSKVTYKVTVCFRRKNLYVRGYSLETNKWMELREDKDDIRHMIATDSQHLSFFGSYDALGTAAKRTVMETPFAKENLKGAVVALFKSTKDEDRARFLIFMAQMISEAARFKDVSKFFGTDIDKVKYVSQDLYNLEKNWSKYSTAVQCYYNYLNDYNFQPVKILGRTYNTPLELRTIFGIMLKETNISDPRTCGIKKLADGDQGEAAVVLSADM